LPSDRKVVVGLHPTRPRLAARLFLGLFDSKPDLQSDALKVLFLENGVAADRVGHPSALKV
jgi:hypothetical protein